MPTAAVFSVWKIWPRPVLADSVRELVAEGCRTFEEGRLFVEEELGNAPLVVMMRQGFSLPVAIWDHARKRIK